MLGLRNILTSLPVFLVSVQLNVDGMVGPMGFKGGTSLSALLIVAWSTLMNGVECTSNEDTERHLEMGKKFLAAGQFSDALSHYHAAVEADPNNYLTYFRRATVYLAMGRSKSALPDLDKVVELRPDFTAARMQRGNVKLKQGRLHEALKDYNEILVNEPDNAEAQRQVSLIEPLETEISDARRFSDMQDYQSAIDLLTRAIEICPWDPELRELRAECYLHLGDYFKAISDIRPTTKLRSDNTAGFYKLSKLHYEMGEADESLTEIRECLKLDPDHKDCFPHYKKVKKLVKQIKSVQDFIASEQWEECINKANQMLKTEPKVYSYVLRSRGHLCHCNSKAGKLQEALSDCQDVLNMDENNIEALCDRAEAYLANEQYDEAIKDYKTAQQIDEHYQRVQDGLGRAEKLLKQSQKRDYYKILGVKRNAKKKEILKAYRKLAVKWHPDKYEGDDKKKAEKNFIDIAAAKEVLTDPEKRAKFDNGEDPLDPEEQAGGGGPFWHQGFNPFNSGGFQFKFHFN